MMRILCLFVFVLCNMGAFSQVVFQNDEVKVSVLKDKTYVFETWDYTTMYLLEGDDKAILIDTGTKCAGLDKIVKRVTNKPFEVVVTHAHPDHAGCIGYFDEVWIHPYDSVLISEYCKDYKGEILDLSDGQVFDLGNRKLEVALMPGHTPGSVVLLDKAQGDCYSGDAFGSGEVWLQCVPMSPFSIFNQSCLKIEKMMLDGTISKIWCGHYPYFKSFLGVEYIQKMIALSRRLMNGDQKGAVVYTNRAIPQPPTTRKLSDGFAMIVYDICNVPTNSSVK
mgnify:CR=1 FL=1